jgi:hypothetical protein
MAVATTVKRVRTATNAGALATATTMPSFSALLAGVLRLADA